MTAFALSGIRFSYREQPVLNGLDISIEKGKLHAVVGANGAGKSTLIKLLAGLLEPDEGEVLYEESPLHSFSAKERARRIAYMAQEVQVPSIFTASEIVTMARYPHKNTSAQMRDRDEIHEAMARTRTLPLYDKRMGEISGGEKQRVLLARALAQSAQALLLDEVTSALDIHHQLAVMEDLRGWLTPDRTVVMVLHDINLAARYADEIWMIADSRVYAHGVPEEVIHRNSIRDVFSVESMIDRNVVTGTPVVIPVEQRNRPLEGVAVGVICGGGSGREVLSALSGWGAEILTGVLNTGDSDQVTAERLGVEVMKIPAFSEVDEIDSKQLKEMMSTKKAIVMTNLPVGAGNFRNLYAAIHSKEIGIPLYYCPWNIGQQYVHKEYEWLWKQAISLSVHCTTESELQKKMKGSLIGKGPI